MDLLSKCGLENLLVYVTALNVRVLVSLFATMAVDDTRRLSRYRGLFFVLGVFSVFLQAGLYAGRRLTIRNFQNSQEIEPGSIITEHPIPIRKGLNKRQSRW